MPIDTEDREPLNITGDPPPQQPMSQRQISGQQKAQANRTRQGPQPAGKGMAPGQQAPAGKPDKSPAQTPESKSGQTQQQIASEMPQQADTAHGVGPAAQALVGGIGDVLQDPEWMKHPLLRLFADSGGPDQGA